MILPPPRSGQCVLMLATTAGHHTQHALEGAGVESIEFTGDRGAYVCVCVRERDRQREKERQIEKEREIQRHIERERKREREREK